MRSLLLVAFAFASIGCRGGFPPRLPTSGLVPAESSSHDVRVARMDPTIVAYVGELTAEGLTKLQQATGDEVRTLRIRSGGGYVKVGISFGEWIRDRRLDVEVVDFCLSSCANYVFTAAVRKTVLPGGVVAWHGDAHLDFPHADLERVRRSAAARGDPDPMPDLVSLRARETEFFESIHVDECVCRIGAELGAHGFFAMSPDDLARFGVTGAVAPRKASDIDPAMRRWLPFRFIELPREMNLRAACAQPGHSPSAVLDAR